MTLSDLTALVAGVAFALPLEPMVRESEITYLQVSEPWATLIRIGDYTSKFNIALVVVVLARRIRFGNTLRSIQWLIITNAMCSVHWHSCLAGCAGSHNGSACICMPIIRPAGSLANTGPGTSLGFWASRPSCSADCSPEDDVPPAEIAAARHAAPVRVLGACLSLEMRAPAPMADFAAVRVLR